MGSVICAYTGSACACVVAGGQRREWMCQRLGDAANPDCPAMAPMSGAACPGIDGTFCRYAQNAFCVCDRQEQWQCQP